MNPDTGRIYEGDQLAGLGRREKRHVMPITLAEANAMAGVPKRKRGDALAKARKAERQARRLNRRKAKR